MAALQRAGEGEATITDPDRFGVIFDLYFSEIHGYVARRLGSDAADDIAADTFLTAFRKRRRFDPERGSIRAWLYGIATNLIGKHRRAELRALRALARTGAVSSTDGPEERVAAQVSAEKHRVRLTNAIATLKAGDRDVLVLSALADLSHAEIAEALDIPVGTVGSRLHRARIRLRSALGDIDPTTEDAHG